MLTMVLRRSERSSAVLLWDHMTVSGGGIPRKEQEICRVPPSGMSTIPELSAVTTGATVTVSERKRRGEN